MATRYPLMMEHISVRHTHLSPFLISQVAADRLHVLAEHIDHAVALDAGMQRDQIPGMILCGGHGKVSRGKSQGWQPGVGLTLSITALFSD